MALTTGQVGFVYGTVGVVALTLGGLVGGWAVARYGLRRCLWPMALLLTLPNLVYVYFSWGTALFAGDCQCLRGRRAVGLRIRIHRLYALHDYLLRRAARTAHYALCTAFMALGMMLPGMGAGWIADRIGYTLFFRVGDGVYVAGFCVAAFSENSI